MERVQEKIVEFQNQIHGTLSKTTNLINQILQTKSNQSKAQSMLELTLTQLSPSSRMLYRECARLQLVHTHLCTDLN